MGGEQANATAEGAHLSGVSAAAFRKDDDVVAFVGHFSGELEAFPVSRALRQGEDIEEGGDEEVIKLVKQATEERNVRRGITHGAQHFTLHGHGNASAHAEG